MLTSEVRDVLFNTGFGCIQCKQNIDDKSTFLSQLKQRMSHMFSVFDSSPECFIYKYMVNILCLQSYLQKPITFKYKQILCKYRISAHSLSIETGRYHNINIHNRHNSTSCCCSSSRSGGGGCRSSYGSGGGGRSSSRSSNSSSNSKGGGGCSSSGGGRSSSSSSSSNSKCGGGCSSSSNCGKSGSSSSGKSSGSSKSSKKKTETDEQ